MEIEIKLTLVLAGCNFLSIRLDCNCPHVSKIEESKKTKASNANSTHCRSEALELGFLSTEEHRIQLTKKNKEDHSTSGD